MLRYDQAEFLEQGLRAQNFTMQHGQFDHAAADVRPSSFCEKSMHGHGMTMYMDGFHFTLNSIYRTNEHALSCLNIFTASWTLSSPLRFYSAMILVTALGISIEAISTYKIRLSITNTRKIKKFYISLLNFIQALIGYLLMLAVMSYSIELLLCASSGYALGHSIFDDKKQQYLKMKNQPTDSNPCHLEFGDDLGATVTAMKTKRNNDDHRRNDGCLSTDQETVGLLSRRSGPILLNS